MCPTGTCDVSTHRCSSCGDSDGAPCCPPDASRATASCRGDPHLRCQFGSGTETSGTCVKCGSLGKPPCDGVCDSGLGIRKGVCAQCGADSQPPCDEACNPGLGIANQVCRHCGGEGEVPCDNGCARGLALVNGLCTLCGGVGQKPCQNGCESPLRVAKGVCQSCGSSYQIPCDTGCDKGLVLVGDTCTPCGNPNQQPCQNGCNSPLKIKRGLCQACGAANQGPCDSGCDPGLILEGPVCASPPPGPTTCAPVNNACVPNTQPGLHCCQPSGAPTLCDYGTCRACVPHGKECALYGPQLCCDAQNGDVCKLDQATEKVVCDIPDAPGK